MFPVRHSGAAAAALITVADLSSTIAASGTDSQPQRRQRWQIAQVALNPFGPNVGSP